MFTYRGKRVHRLNNHGWRNAWADAGLPVSDTFYRGVHNLKHTFGMRLRHAGVSLETRKFLLGHTNGDITTHYSDAQLQELVDAAEKALGSREIHEMNLLRLAMSRK